MIRCETIERWLPWYASGQISTRKMQVMAEHIANCETCQTALAKVIQLRHRVASSLTEAPVPTTQVWESLTERLPEAASAQIDLGSFLVGLNVGVAAQRRNAPVRGDLRVLGHRVRIIGKHKKGA